MPSYSGDARHQRLLAILPPLISRACPQNAGGYGGGYELRLTRQEVDEVGGLDLLRSALRGAARSLGWSKLETYGTNTMDGAVAGVVDRRPVPAEFVPAVEAHRWARMRSAVERTARCTADGTRYAVPVSLATQEFRAAYTNQEA